MPINSVRTALQLLTGAGELTRAKALEAAGTLLELPGVGETSARAGQLAEELLEAATANQAMVQDIVRTEVDRRLVQLGLARGSDLEAAQHKIEALEAEVAALRAAAPSAAEPTVDRAPRPSRAGIANRTSTTKAAGKRKPVKKQAAKEQLPKKQAATKSAATKSAATKSAATKSAATKSAATKSAVKRPTKNPSTRTS